MPAFRDITGLRFGRLTVLKFLHMAKGEDRGGSANATAER